MKISELIITLTGLKTEHGDLTVLTYDGQYYVEALRAQIHTENKTPFVLLHE